MTLIPTTRLVDWTPGTATGVPSGIPSSRTMYVNALTGALGGGGTYGGALATGDGVADDYAALQAMIDACPSNKYVYLPTATYKVSTQLVFGPGNSNISLKGAGQTLTLIKSAATTAFQIGDTRNYGPPAGASEADVVVTSGLAKNATTLTLSNATNFVNGSMAMLNVDNDEDSPDMSTSGFRFMVKQWVKISSHTSTTITFSPGLYSNYGSGTIDARVYAAPDHTEAVGIEDLFLELVPAGQVGFDLNQAYGCWIKNCRIKGIVNYAVKLGNSLKCEVRHCLIDPRDSSGTSGAGIFIEADSGCLVEDNVIVGDWITIIMQVNGASGNFVSRNFGNSTNTYDTNHDPLNQFNLWEGNAGSGSITSDGYFGGERYATYYNNFVPGISLKRFTRDANIVGNVFSGATAGVPGNTGYPNIVDGSYVTPGAQYYTGNHSVPWRDYGMVGTTAAITIGSGTGYLVNHGGGYAIGSSSIVTDTGSGTILAGNMVTFSGSAYSYFVEAFSGGVLTIGMRSDVPSSGAKGLVESILDNATITVSALGKGSGTGYLSVGTYSIGATAITLDTGSGTILPNDVVTFAGSTYRYKVVSFSTGTLTISTSHTGATGLVSALGDNVAVTVETDFVKVNYSSGLLHSYDGFNYQYATLHWGGYATNQRYRVAVATSSYAILVNDQATPNAIASPAVSTSLDAIGPGSYINSPDGSFQELDLGVAATMVLKGNRYADGYFDALGGDTMPSSFGYGETRPTWLNDAEAEYPGAAYNLRPFDPVSGFPASNSDIPAGYRFFYLVDPEFVSAGVNAAGTELTLSINKTVQIGAGGSGGVTIGGGSITPTFNRVTGSNVVFSLSRVVVEGEALTISYVQPGNGIEAVSNGNDVPSFTGQTVSNSSSVTTGVVHYGPDRVGMTQTAAQSDSSSVNLQKVLVEHNGTALAVRFYVTANVFNAAFRAIVSDVSGNVLSTSGANGAVSGSDRWMSIPITSFSVTASTNYLVGFQFLAGAGDPVWAANLGQASGISYTAAGITFASAVPSSLGTLTAQTTEHAYQLRVSVDESSTGVTHIGGTLTVGTLILS